MLPGDFTACVLTLSLISAWQVARDAYILRLTPQLLPNCTNSFILSIRSFSRSLVGHLTGPNYYCLQHYVLHNAFSKVYNRTIMHFSLTRLLEYMLFISWINVIYVRDQIFKRDQFLLWSDKSTLPKVWAKILITIIRGRHFNIKLFKAELSGWK